MRKNVIIPIAIIVFVLVMCTWVFLYIETDFFKEKDMLFQKYLAQGLSEVVQDIDVSNIENYFIELQKQDYSKKTEIDLKFSEKEDDQPELYNIKGAAIVNNSDQTSYRKLVAKYGEEELLNTEFLEKENMYGLRFSNIVKQFVTFENSNISYVISSMGYKGQYLSEKLNKADAVSLLKFSDEEKSSLQNKYINIIFSDVNKKSYSKTLNSTITLGNGQSVTTTAYSLVVNKNELDRMYKRLLSQLAEDEIILNKLDAVQKKFEEAGFTLQEGESLKDKYSSSLKQKADEIEYEGTDTRKIMFTVYQANKNTLRIEVKDETQQINLDMLALNGENTLYLKTIKNTNDGQDVRSYSLGCKDEENRIIRKISYAENDNVNFNTEIEFTNSQNRKDINFEGKYSDKNIKDFSFTGKEELDFSQKAKIPVAFNDENNIVLNDYDGEKINSILKELKFRVISNLNETQLKINTKMLNNILIMIDNREKRLAQEELENIELQKKRFNNKFELYKGQDLKYNTIINLLKSAKYNMKDYKVENGKIEILIEKGVENEAKAAEIEPSITNDRTYDVDIKYSKDGVINAIIISVYKK